MKAAALALVLTERLAEQHNTLQPLCERAAGPLPRAWGGASEAKVKQVEVRGKKGAPGRGAANARPDANRDEWRMWLWQRSTKGASVRDESLGGRVRPPRSQWATLKRMSLVFKTAGSHPEGPEILLRLLWLQLIRQVAGCKRRGRRAHRAPMYPIGTEPCTAWRDTWVGCWSPRSGQEADSGASSPQMGPGVRRAGAITWESAEGKEA